MPVKVIHKNRRRCPESWLTDRCAVKVLKSACGPSKEIGDIVSIESFPSVPNSRTVVYEFKKLPQPGESVSAETFRANATFIYQKTKDSSGQESGDWQSSCE